MEKLFIILTVVLVSLIFMMLWNNISLDRLKNIVKNGDNHLPDDKYFELKYKIQYITFAATLIITTAGLLGYNSILEIETNVYEKLNNITQNQTTRVDSLLRVRIDNTSKNIEDSKNITLSYLKETSKLLDGYVNDVSRLNKKINFNNMYIINDVIIPNTNNKVSKIYFKNLGLNEFIKTPSLFIQPKNQELIKLNRVNKESFEILVEKTKSDSIHFSLMIFI